MKKRTLLLLEFVKENIFYYFKDEEHNIIKPLQMQFNVGKVFLALEF